jgi:PleD family two-component response regulator/EAL domain-containing protein (putative c-di-GMP-specific phosphodiesterase class I)
MNKSSGINEDLLNLARQYVSTIENRAQTFQTLWQEIIEADDLQADFQPLIVHSHNFTGSAGSYGLDELSTLAGEIEQTVRDFQNNSKSPGSRAKRDMGNRISRLLALTSEVTLESVLPAVEQMSGELPGRNDEAMIYIVDDDSDQGERLSLQLSSHGFQTRFFTDLDDLREGVLTHAPDGIVADIVFPEGDTAGIEAIASLRNAGARFLLLPMVFISRRTDAEARLEALRAGGSGYFTKPVDVPALAAKLHQLTNSTEEQPHRIMIVDDDATSSLLHAAMLKRGGYDVRTINNPMEIIQAATEFRPELIFMDLYMPEADGLEVAAMLRQEELFLDVPIVFLSGEDDELIKEKAIRRGASSFLHKPISADQLLGVASAHAYQFRLRADKSRYLRRIDPDTGLYSREYLLSSMGRYSRLIESKRNYFASLLLLEIDRYGYLLRTVGEDNMRLLRARIAKLIRETLGKNDLAGVSSTSGFLVLSLQSSVAGLDDFAHKLHDTIAMTPLDILGQTYDVTVSIGASKVAEGDQNQVLSEAALACSLAQKEGGSQILLHSELQQEVKEGHQGQHLRQQLKQALKNKRIFLDYSPLMGIAVETVDRFSVSMRLYDEDGKILYPAQFFSVARKYHLLPTLDRWVIMEALQVLKGVAAQPGNSAQLLIKLSKATILDKEFPGWLEKVSRKFSVPEKSCVFEIREDDITGNMQQVQNLTQSIGRLQCDLVIERFGVNMDAFNLLPQLNPGFLRLAPPLFDDLHENEEKQEYVQNICERAHSQNCKVLAAYTQDSRVLTHLWRLGVDYIQGDMLERTPTYLSPLLNESRASR